MDNTQGKPACVPQGHAVIQCAPCEVAQRQSGWLYSTVVGGSNPPFAAEAAPPTRIDMRYEPARRRHPHGADESSTIPARATLGRVEPGSGAPGSKAREVVLTSLDQAFSMSDGRDVHDTLTTVIERRLRTRSIMSEEHLELEEIGRELWASPLQSPR